MALAINIHIRISCAWFQCENHYHPSRTHLSGVNNDVFYLSSVVTLERSCESSWELKRRGGEKYLSGDRSTNNLKTQ